MSGIYYERFIDEFYPVLGQFGRWEAFKYIAAKLLARPRSVYLIETGCVRLKDNWQGDGQSTRVWNWILEQKGGIGEAFDIDRTAVNCAEALCPAMIVSETDSIYGILTSHWLDVLDLLYLDSFDYKPGTKHLSALHHVGELAAAYSKLPSGCMIAIDDCLSDTEGKHVMVKKFFDMIGVAPVVTGYITIWEKP